MTIERPQRHRLHVRRITSIGAVEEGDNPGAQIMFWKRRDPKPDTAAGLSPAQKWANVPAALAALDDRIAKAVDRVEADAAAVQRIAEERNDVVKVPDTFPEGTIRRQVDEIAAEMVANGEASNITQARPLVWKARPDLRDLSRANKETANLPRSRPSHETDTAQRVVAAVADWADELSAQQGNWNKQAAELRAEIWRTPQGRQLRELYTDAHHKGEKVAKSNDHADAVQVLKRLEDDPRSYL